MKKLGKLRIFLFIYGFARPHLPIMIIGMLLYTSQAVTFPLIHSVLMGGITSAMLNMDFTELFTAGLQAIAMLILAIILVAPGALLFVIGALKTKRRLQIKMIRAFMNADIETGVHSGERLSALNTDVNYAHNLYSNALAPLISCLAPIVILSAVVFAINWRIGLYTLLAGMLSMIAQALLAKPLAKIAASELVTFTVITKTLRDIFAGGVVVRVFALQGKLMEVFEQDNDEIRRLTDCKAQINGAQALFAGISSLLTTGGVFIVGSILISHKTLSLPALMTIVPMCSSVALSISKIGGAWAGMQAPLEAGRRLYELLDGDNRLTPIVEKVKSSIPKDYKIEVKGLVFSFRNAENPIFKNVSFNVEENHFAVFVGESGSGKSTLMKLIAGLFDCGDLDITIGGKRLSETGVEKWRSYFAYVDQNCTLFDLTIAENIALGNEHATFDEIKSAAMAADADSFISAFPKGYHTKVGEIGSMLSGGQRQRIAIARALVRHSPVMIFDEATSALNKDSAQEVIETINKLRGKHTILMVTHDLSMIDPDAIYIVGDGRVMSKEG